METKPLNNTHEPIDNTTVKEGQTLSLTQQLGGVEYDHKLHSSVEPIYERLSGHNNVISELIIRNPNESQLRIDLSTYKGLGSRETINLRNALVETYQREAQTEYGTSLLTETAQYIQKASWVTLKNSGIMNDASKLQMSLANGILQGSFLRKSKEAQSEIFYQQHEALLYAIDSAKPQSLHPESDVRTNLGITYNNSGKAHLNNQTLDPIERALSGNTLLSPAGIAQTYFIYTNENVTPNASSATLNDLLSGHKQQKEILTLLLQKQNESNQSLTATSDTQNEHNR